MENYRGLLDVERRPMSQSESAMFIQLSITELQSRGTDEIHEKMMESSLGYKIMVEWLTRVGSISQVTRPLLFFLATIIDRPGVAVLWAYTLNLLAHSGGLVNVDEWVNHFPNGVPTTSGLKTAWDAQKGYNIGEPNVDNWIDDFSHWPHT